MNHEFLYRQKGLLTYIRVIMCHHPHDPHFTPKILQYTTNETEHMSGARNFVAVVQNGSNK